MVSSILLTLLIVKMFDILKEQPKNIYYKYQKHILKNEFLYYIYLLNAYQEDY